METELVATASALERHVTANPAVGSAALTAAIRAANDPDITDIESGLHGTRPPAKSIYIPDYPLVQAEKLTQTLQAEILMDCGLVVTPHGAGFRAGCRLPHGVGFVTQGADFPRQPGCY